MKSMKSRKHDPLGHDDQCAVDLVMEHRAAGPANGWAQCFHKNMSAGMRKRIDRVEKLLGLLDLMPAADPPANLVTKTLRRIEQSTGRRIPADPMAGTRGQAHNP